MAGAEKIIQKILEEAQLQAQANLEQARKEAAEINNTAKMEADPKIGIIIDKALRDSADRQTRLIASAGLEARKQKLQAKQRLIEEAFEKALERLISLPAEAYKNMLSDMITGLVKNDEVEIILSPKDSINLGTVLVETVNSRLHANGTKGSVVLSGETRNIKGGFILRMGDIEINNSLEAVIKAQKSLLEADVVKILFSDK